MAKGRVQREMRIGASPRRRLSMSFTHLMCPLILGICLGCYSPVEEWAGLSCSSGTPESSCKEGFTCDKGQCIKTPTVPPDVGTCTLDSDCAWFKEKFGVDLVCDPVANVCTSCLKNSDCAAGICVAQTCLQCSPDYPCADGWNCIQGSCYSQSTTGSGGDQIQERGN